MEMLPWTNQSTLSGTIILTDRTRSCFYVDNVFCTSMLSHQIEHSFRMLRYRASKEPYIIEPLMTTFSGYVLAVIVSLV